MILLRVVSDQKNSLFHVFFYELCCEGPQNEQKIHWPGPFGMHARFCALS